MSSIYNVNREATKFIIVLIILATRQDHWKIRHLKNFWNKAINLSRLSVALSLDHQSE